METQPHLDLYATPLRREDRASEAGLREPSAVGAGSWGCDHCARLSSLFWHRQGVKKSRQSSRAGCARTAGLHFAFPCVVS